jgi:hypothetical protein
MDMDAALIMHKIAVKHVGLVPFGVLNWGASYTFHLQITRMWELQIRVRELNIDIVGHVHIFGQS